MRNDRLQRLLAECRERQKRKHRREEQRLKALQRELIEDIAYRQLIREKRAERALKQQQERLKQESKYLNDFRLIFDEDHLYTTREELYMQEARGNGKIDWNAWDRIVQQFHGDNNMAVS